MGRYNKSRMELKQRRKPTDLFCENCLIELIALGNLEKKYLFCENCNKSVPRTRALTFADMIRIKFERVKHRNLNQLKRDMRP